MTANVRTASGRAHVLILELSMPMPRTLFIAAAAMVLAACGSSDAIVPDSPPDAAAKWAAVDSVVRAQIATAGGASALTLSVYDRSDVPVFERSYGGFSPDTRLAVASASKLIAGMVLLDVIARGELSLTSTTGAVLGWTGARGTITLEQLLSFTSGLDNQNACTFNALVTLAQCVATISTQPVVAAPGTRFDYGSTHLHVAARMAEVASGKSWNTLFRERLAEPLGLASGVRYYTLPNQAVGESNPLVAGGLRASARDYGKLLALAYHNGRVGSVTLATPALFAAQAREPFPGVVIGSSPYGTPLPVFRYGLGAWLECATPASGCPSISSAGLYGFTPWLDRSSGYYATIAMEQLDGRATAFSVRLQQAVKPFIVAALRAN